MSFAPDGIYEKYVVERTDGHSDPGQKHEHCEYFVLDVTHDPYAIPALEAYAAACQGDNAELSADIMRFWVTPATAHQEAAEE